MLSQNSFIQTYQNVRRKTESLCSSLQIEDFVIQSIDDVSPPKWHLAHTTWFFETFILTQSSSYKIFNPLFQHLFNSYYQSVNLPYPRIKRGLLSRPTVKEIFAYRKYVDEHFVKYMDEISTEELISLKPIIELGLHHEQQHQELLLMDIKYNFSIDPSYPVYHTNKQYNHMNFPAVKKLEYMYVEGGIIVVGNKGNDFCFDNELPAHQVMLKPYRIANRLVTIEEYMEFIEAGGYKDPAYWLADGWECVLKNHWDAPQYWKKIENKWYLFTLSGLKLLNLSEPVSHISYYEADAFSNFKKMRLPTEMEWEQVASMHPELSKTGNFLENNYLHPTSSELLSMQQLFGDLWEWTASAYSPYPGYKPLTGALGEYNGKFMSNQIVLRGGSCVTPQSHIRATYRNFFQPEKRWQFSGIRLADNL